MTVQSNPGAYALLLGSGTSRSAGIPTGWDVTLDLIRRVAAAADEDPGIDPEAWYVGRFDRPPRYSELLKEITRSPTERSQLLRGYFEPSEVEREQGLKLPKPGHRAIARLVADGYVRLILQTNFDNLTETAIREAGIEPTIITSAHALQGATPLDRSKCTIAKLHGDYLDSRILNTDEELARYAPGLNRFLDRVFDEFGLVVVGWSAEWDVALRSAIERRRNRRYGFYWTTRSDPTELAARLIHQQGADLIRIADADGFLTDLADRVQAVADVQRQPPLAIDTAVAMVKRFIVDDSSRIRLHDLVTEEVERVYARIGPAPGSVTITSDLVNGWMKEAEASTEVLRAIVACGTYWAPNYSDLWSKGLQRLANPAGANVAMNEGFDPRYLPALLVLYAAGIGAAAVGNYDILEGILQKAHVREYSRETPIGGKLIPVAVLDGRFASVLQVIPGAHTPFSQYLEPALRASLRFVIAADSDYFDAFDRFEYLLALTYADYQLEKNRGAYSFLGCFAWRRRIVTLIDSEIAEQGTAWPALRLFGGSSERLAASRDVIKNAMPGYWS